MFVVLLLLWDFLLISYIYYNYNIWFKIHISIVCRWYTILKKLNILKIVELGKFHSYTKKKKTQKSASYTEKLTKKIIKKKGKQFFFLFLVIVYCCVCGCDTDEVCLVLSSFSFLLFFRVFFFLFLF